MGESNLMLYPYITLIRYAHSEIIINALNKEIGKR